MGNTWFMYAISGPFLYAICNMIDKNLLEKYLKGSGGVSTLIIVSGVLSILACPIFWLIDSSIFAVSTGHLSVLIGTALLDVVVLWAYLKALKDHDTSVVIIFYQLVPVLGLVFGWIFLKEVVGATQGVAMAVIIAGATLVSVEHTAAGFHFRKKAIAYMGLACTAWAFELTIFKIVSLEENVWRSLFWKHVALTVVGAAIFAFKMRVRRRFLRNLRLNSTPIIGLNVVNEVLYMTGNAFTAYASMLAPVALVLLGQSFQPFFVLMLGVILSAVTTKVVGESHDRKEIIQKLLAIGLTIYGTYLLLNA